MNGTMEDLLRQALQRQAERAVDPARVRAALPSRAARRTRRRFGSLAAGLAAAAALTAFAVPVLGLDDAPTGGTGAGPAASPSASASAPAPAQVTPEAVAMRYKPTWLPAGLRERARTVPVGPGNAYDGPVRIWKPAGAEGGTDKGGSRLEFGAIGLKDGANQFGDFGRQVDVNGRLGRLVGSADTKSYVHWLIDPQTVIFIHNVSLGLSDDDLLRVARSVQPDPGQLPIPLRLGWLPTGMAPFSAEVAGDSASRWQVEITAMGQPPAGPPAQPTAAKDKEGASSGERWIYARLGPATDAPAGGEAVDVGGRPARVVARAGEGPVPFEHTYVVVALDSGLTLTVHAMVPEVSRADLLAVAAAIDVASAPDLSWLGT
jgi:hypothetical protein